MTDDDSEWERARPVLDEWAARAGYLTIGRIPDTVRRWADMELQYRLVRRPVGYDVILLNRGAASRWARFQTLPPATLFLLGCFVSDCVPFPRSADLSSSQPGDSSVLASDEEGFRVISDDGSVSHFNDQYSAADFARYQSLGWGKLVRLRPR